MPSRAEVMRVYTGIDIDSGLLDEAKSECDGLDLTTTATVKVFPPGQICGKILDSVKKQVYFTPKRNEYRYRRSSRDDRLHGRYVGEVVTLPGANTPYLLAPCIAIPIKTKGLPTSLTTRNGQNFAVDWEAGMAWEILQDVKPVAVHEKGGTLLLLYLES